MKARALCVTIAWLCGSTAALGQVTYYGPAYGPGYGGTTVAGSTATGMANAIQAQGQRNLADSQAAINLQDAYSKGIDNNVKATNAYYEKKAIYNQQMQPIRYERAQQAAAYVAKNTIQPPASGDFDRTTGRINWPSALRDPHYDQYRKPLDAIFQKRAEGGILSADDYMAATTASKEWRLQLAKESNEYPDNVLHLMIRFILSMDKELNDRLS